MDVVLLVGRVLFGALFVASALGHLTQAETMAGYAASRGVPKAKPLVILTGAQILVGAISVVLGLWGDLGSLLLVAFLIPTAGLMHAFWRETEPMIRQMEMVHFNKDVALAGAALALLWAFSQDPGLTVTGPLF